MTYLSLKIIAILTMTIDHLGLILSRIPSLNLDPSLVIAMRSVGRIAFPIFAFGIVNGMNHTKDKEKYFYRLALFMGISQLPFSMLVSQENYLVEFLGKDLFNLSFSLAKTPSLLILSGLLFIIFAINKKGKIKSVGALALALILANISIYTPAGYVINDAFSLNIFYTLGVGAYFIKTLEGFKDPIKGSKFLGNNLLDTLALVLMVVIFIPYSDYSFMGLVLILGFYVFKNSKALSLLYMAIWLFLQYGGFGPMNSYFLASLVSVLALALYKGEKGRGPKFLQKLFYIYYPLHLVLGLGLVALLK